MKRILMILWLLLSLNRLSMSQSITISPINNSQSLNSSIIGTNTVKIEGLPFTDPDFDYFQSGNSRLELVGNPNFGFDGVVSSNVIAFKHGNTSRWSISDYLLTNFDSSINSFSITDHGTTTSFTHFSIGKRTNRVSLSNLQIGSLSSENFNGRNLKISTLGNVTAAPNQFLSLGALDITTLGSGTVSKDFSGSFGPNATSQSIYLPIHLPDFSKIVRFTVTYLDNSPSSSLSVSLVGTPNTIATVTSTNLTVNNTATMRPTSYSGSLIVDNEIKQYYFEIKPRNQTNTSSGTWNNALLSIQKIIIEFQ